MNDIVLRVDNLGKAFRRYRREAHRFLSWFGLNYTPLEEFWALREVGFSVTRGEAVGIVGQNGAGKSTLLKLITGTLRPTEGTVGIAGRISAILELGLGFHPEFTGRRNATHSAGLMGFDQDQINAMMPGIEEFAEIGDYFDKPVRTYSSGMQMRLAFSTATAMRPEILIVDEALSVGDAYFQHKSFARIREYKRLGTSLLIVSHDKSAVQALCDRAILLHKGHILKDDTPELVMDCYNALLADEENRTLELVTGLDGKVRTRSGTGEACIEDIALLSKSGAELRMVAVGQEVDLRVTVRTRADIPRLVLGYMIKDHLGQSIFGTNTHFTDQALENLPDSSTRIFSIRFTANMGPGNYSVAVNLADGETHLAHNYEWRDLALVFTVANLDKDSFVGSNWLPPEIQIHPPQTPQPQSAQQPQ